MIKDHASRIGIALGENGICFCRLDGSLDSKSQDRCLIDFTTSVTKNVFLASIQKAGVGLNITCASVAFIMVRNLNNQNQFIMKINKKQKTSGTTLEPHS